MNGAPNIVMLMCDGMRLDTVGMLNDTPCRTPTWDRVAKEGVFLRNLRSTAPMCSPARASIFTGLQPHQAGMGTCSLTYVEDGGETGDADCPAITAPPLSHYLRESGYETFYAGKWHMGEDNCRQWFDWSAACDQRDRDYSEWCRYQGIPDGFIFHDAVRSKPYRSKEYPGMSLYTPGILDIPEDKEHNYWVLGHALELLAMRRTDRPFFMTLSFEGPHPPLVAPERYYNMYDPADVVEPENWTANEREPSFLDGSYYRRIRNEWSENFDDWRKPIAVSWGYVTYVDSLFGMFLDRLSELGLMDTTAVVMLADHGDMFGQHGLSQIFCPYEEVLRVPCAIRRPGVIAPGSQCDMDASGVDIAPTVLAAAGIDPETLAMEGENLLPYLRGEKDEPPSRDCFAEYNLSPFFATWQGVQNWRCLVRRPWKYVLHENGEAELFNLVEDPHERVNLAGAGQVRDNESDLREALLESARRRGDPFAERVA